MIEELVGGMTIKMQPEKMMQPWNYDVEAARDHYESLSGYNVEAACIRDADDRGRRKQSVLRGRLGDDGWHLDFGDGLVACPTYVEVYAWRAWPFPPDTRIPTGRETAVEKYNKLLAQQGCEGKGLEPYWGADMRSESNNSVFDAEGDTLCTASNPSVADFVASVLNEWSEAHQEIY